jgi:hypothetical protein
MMISSTGEGVIVGIAVAPKASELIFLVHCF